ncbi:MAG: hypothetical protein WA771_07510 [Chthoniobacterales bacterium]
MASDDFGVPELWDEYDWERFLQQQDQKTEQYFALFEKYANDPDRDEIIAREMGWNQGGEDDEEEGELEEPWSAVGDFEIDDEAEDDEAESEVLDFDEDEEDDDAEFAELQNSTVYVQSMELNRRVFAMVEEREDLRDNADAGEMATRIAICAAKLAAALCGDDQSEIGMTIAYLKRSLKAATDALNAACRLHDAGVLSVEDLRSLTELLFPVREEIVDLMRDYRQKLSRLRGER